MINNYPPEVPVFLAHAYLLLSRVTTPIIRFTIAFIYVYQVMVNSLLTRHKGYASLIVFSIEKIREWYVFSS